MDFIMLSHLAPISKIKIYNTDSLNFILDIIATSWRKYGKKIWVAQVEHNFLLRLKHPWLEIV